MTKYDQDFETELDAEDDYNGTALCVSAGLTTGL